MASWQAKHRDPLFDQSTQAALERRGKELLGAGLVILGVLIALVWASRALRGQMRRNGLALLGLAVLCGFVLVRAVGFHHVDRLISTDFANIKFNFWFENAGLVLIAINAVWLLRRGR